MIHKENYSNYKWTIYSLIFFNIFNLIIVILSKQQFLTLIQLFQIETYIIVFFSTLKFIFTKEIIKKRVWIKLLFLVFFNAIFIITITLLFNLVYGLLLISDSIAGVEQNLVNDSNFSTNIFWISLSVFISHLLSFFINYISKKEYKKAEGSKILFSCISRVSFIYILGLVVFGIIFPAKIFFMREDYLNILFIIILFVIKILIDMDLHIKEHNGYIFGDLSKHWSKILEEEKEKKGVKVLDEKTLKELYAKIENGKYGS